MVRSLRLTLLGVGAMNSPRYAPAGLLLQFARSRIAFDGGPGAEPAGRVDAWLVTDERSELRTALRRLAAEHGVALAMAGHTAGDLHLKPHPVAHTSHPTCGYAIRAGDRLVVWAPEFWRFPAWAAGADLIVRRGRRLGPADPVPGWRGRARQPAQHRRAGRAARRPPACVRTHRPTGDPRHRGRTAPTRRRVGHRRPHLPVTGA